MPGFCRLSVNCLPEPPISAGSYWMVGGINRLWEHSPAGTQFIKNYKAIAIRPLWRAKTILVKHKIYANFLSLYMYGEELWCYLVCLRSVFSCSNGTTGALVLTHLLSHITVTPLTWRSWTSPPNWVHFCIFHGPSCTWVAIFFEHLMIPLFVVLYPLKTWKSSICETCWNIHLCTIHMMWYDMMFWYYLYLLKWKVLGLKHVTCSNLNIDVPGLNFNPWP